MPEEQRSKCTRTAKTISLPGLRLIAPQLGFLSGSGFNCPLADSLCTSKSDTALLSLEESCGKILAAEMLISRM